MFCVFVCVYVVDSIARLMRSELGTLFCATLHSLVYFKTTYATAGGPAYAFAVEFVSRYDVPSRWRVPKWRPAGGRHWCCVRDSMVCNSPCKQRCNFFASATGVISRRDKGCGTGDRGTTWIIKCKQSVTTQWSTHFACTETETAAWSRV